MLCCEIQVVSIISALLFLPILLLASSTVLDSAKPNKDFLAVFPTVPSFHNLKGSFKTVCQINFGLT